MQYDWADWHVTRQGAKGDFRRMGRGDGGFGGGGVPGCGLPELQPGGAISAESAWV